ncbi:LuxR C-terminal-related transcriptional regulator [Rhodococcus oxybenzonivorans]|uniref:ATP-binding protein n=1 Tax=Rhodococcus oxybenzonivorans TaxID=1990687 RepID=UPI00295453C8|nr:LuxR C-terminal-related transcriptional regulator [Rhodococcus oxybenzonivorans]MDV7355309.1 LuxR C-terminal-related transcriptional regulator [Rhodococcus oxybenzonivorans]
MIEQCHPSQIPVRGRKSTVNADEWREIVELRQSGESISGIATRLKVSRNTVRRALNFEAPPRDHRPRSGSSADALRPRIAAALDVDPNVTVAQLHRELEWSGSRNTLASAVRRVKEERSRTTGSRTSSIRTSTGTDIPLFSTSFVGRSEDLDKIRVLLGDSRFVTVAGPGGIGKTRLAAEAAATYRRAFSDGVRFVELASLRSETLLPQTILDALGFDERDAPERSATESLLESIRYKHLLLVLDNCEHLVSACAELISLLLRNTEHVKILVTSREVLSIPEEHVLVLDPLSMTDHRDPDRPGPAIELFESRASAALSGFFITDSSRDAARRVCTQLDGMPLAIELACARLTALSVEDLAERLDDRLALLTTGNRGGPSRHRSLHATVEWSYDLCTSQEQVLWARLSVFSEGFDLAAAESVCAGGPVDAASILDTITGLIGKSVLQRTTGEGRVRFKMLETIRHFGAGKLSDGEKAELRVAHLRWCAELVRTARRSWTGAEQERVSARLRENRANLRSALQAALSDRNHETLHLASSLVATWFLWSSAFSVREHRMWVTEFLGRDDMAEDVVAKLNATLGLLQTMQGERVQAARALAAAAQRARELGDNATLAFALQTQGLNTYLGGNFEAGERHLSDALTLYERLPGITDLMWTAHIEMGMLCSSRGETERAAENFEFVYAQASATGEKWMLSYAVYGLGLVELVRGRHDEAITHAMNALALNRAFDDTVGATLVTDLLAWAEAAAGSGERAAVLLGAASSMWESFGMQLYGSRHWVERREVYESRARTSLGDELYTTSRRWGSTLSIAELIAYALDEEPDDNPAASPHPVVGLSPREMDIAQYVAHGLTNREIADRLVLSIRTVEGHVAHLLRKLGIARRSQVAASLAERSARLE